MKIDLQKAFDSVSWEFMAVVFKALNLPAKFVTWMMGCISGARLSISVNGCLEGYFRSERGLRQGDPLSPYVFVMAIEVLSRMLNAAAAEGKLFKYHPRTQRVKLTHLCFADDLLIFGKGSVESVVGINCVLDKFYEFSGLKLNPAKSEVFSAGVRQTVLDDIRQITGFTLGKLPVRYLGVPLVTKRLSLRDCSPLIDGVRKRVNGWAAKSLSYAGRAQLIQSVFMFRAIGLDIFYCLRLF